MEFLIGGIMIGAIGALTVYNTLKLHSKKDAVVEDQSNEQKEREKQFEALMNYRRGRE